MFTCNVNEFKSRSDSLPLITQLRNTDFIIGILRHNTGANATDHNFESRKRCSESETNTIVDMYTSTYTPVLGTTLYQ